MKLLIKRGGLDGNFHGPAGATLRSTWAVVPLGRDCYLKAKGRTLFGWRLWIYRHDGACVNFDVMLKFKRCPLRTGHPQGPQDDGGLGTIML